MVGSGLAEDEENALKNEHGQRHIMAALQVAEWERGTRMVDAWRPRRVWLPPLPFTAAFGGRCDFTTTQCVGSAGVVPPMLMEPHCVRPTPWTRISNWEAGVTADLRSRVPSVKWSGNWRRARFWAGVSCSAWSMERMI